MVFKLWRISGILPQVAGERACMYMGLFPTGPTNKQCDAVNFHYQCHHYVESGICNVPFIHSIGLFDTN